MYTIIVHCGSSKNGSTALQNVLFHDRQRLYKKGISVLRLSCIIKDSLDSYISPNEIEIISDPSQITKQNYCDTVSFGLFYIAYLNYYRAKNTSHLYKLESILLNAIKNAFQSCHTVIISAEAFEISLCLKDYFFKHLLRKLSSLATIKLVYFHPDISRHAIASWQQWFWDIGAPFSEWIKSYLHTYSRKTFFDKKNVSYYGNLVDTNHWLNYWTNNNNYKFDFYSNIPNICSFFYKIYFSEALPIKLVQCSPDFTNTGWPKCFLQLLPYFYNSFGRNYLKFQIIKDLLIDKSNNKNFNITFYKGLLELTKLFFEKRLSIHDSKLQLLKTQNFNNSYNFKEIYDMIDEFFLKYNTVYLENAIEFICHNIFYFHEINVQYPLKSQHSNTL